MCRYKYGNGKCAYPKNISLDCVGEENCTFMNEDTVSEDFEQSDYLPENENGDECPNTECGVYCKKYNRFYCAGKENCTNEDEYLNHMNTFGCVDIERKE